MARPFLAAFLLTAFLSGPAQSEDLESALDTQLQTLHQQSEFPGFAVALVDSGGLIYARGFGQADLEKATPFTAKTVLNIGSVSKTFIGVALLQAVERDLVDLDADINTYLPYPVRNPRFPDTAITLRHLATHTSSLLDREAIYEEAYSEGESPDMELGDYLEKYLKPGAEWASKKNFTKSAPGQNYEYSNIAAALAAHILERVTNENFDAWTRKNILRPLGMKDSGWSYATAARDEHATLYDGKKALAPYTLVTYPDGGLRTSVTSLARYLTAIINQGRVGSTQILEPKSVEAMLARQFPEGAPEGMGRSQLDSGIFWSHRKNGGIGHNGGDPGISTFMVFDPETKRGRIFVTNLGMENRKQVEDFKAIWQALDEAGPLR